MNGKRLVTAVILNRVDSQDFPDTVEEVINQKLGKHYQFSVVANDSINRVDVDENTRLAVEEELKERSNTEVLFFRTKKYHSFGTPILKEGEHYFSGI